MHHLSITPLDTMTLTSQAMARMLILMHGLTLQRPLVRLLSLPVW